MDSHDSIGSGGFTCIGLYAPWEVANMIEPFIFSWFHGLGGRGGEYYPLHDFAYRDSGADEELELILNEHRLPNICHPAENIVVSEAVHKRFEDEQIPIAMRKARVSKLINHPYTLGDFGHREDLFFNQTPLTDYFISAKGRTLSSRESEKIQYWELLPPSIKLMGAYMKCSSFPKFHLRCLPYEANDGDGNPRRDYRVEAWISKEALQEFGVINAGDGHILSLRVWNVIKDSIDLSFWQFEELSL